MSFTPSVRFPRWLLFSTLPQILGAPAWAVFVALVFTLDRLQNMNDPRWSVEDEFSWFKVRIRTELPLQTGLSLRSVQRAVKSIERANLVQVERGRGGDISRVKFEKDTISALARYCLPRLPGYQGGFAGKTALPDHWPYFVGDYWGYPKANAADMQTKAAGRPVDEEEVRGIIASQGGTLPGDEEEDIFA